MEILGKSINLKSHKHELPYFYEDLTRLSEVNT